MVCEFLTLELLCWTLSSSSSSIFSDHLLIIHRFRVIFSHGAVVIDLEIELKKTTTTQTRNHNNKIKSNFINH